MIRHEIIAATHSVKRFTLLGNYFSQVDINEIKVVGNLAFCCFRGYIPNGTPNNVQLLKSDICFTDNQTCIGWISSHEYSVQTPIFFYANTYYIQGNDIPAGRWLHLQVTLVII